jgi:hypothetical protein
VLEVWSPVPGSSAERAVLLLDARGPPGAKVSVVMDGEELLLLDAAAATGLPLVLDRDRPVEPPILSHSLSRRRWRQ